MRTKPSNYSLCLGVLIVFAALPVAAQDKSPVRSAIRVADPDGGSQAVLLGADLIRPSTRDECELVGAILPPLVGQRKYRGNMLRVTDPAELFEFSMELSITWGQPVDLYFSIHVFTEEDGCFRFHRLIDDVVVPVTGHGRDFYSSGLLSDSAGGPLLLDPGDQGLDYVFGVAWGSVSVIYGRDGLTYPRPFSHGSIRGSIAASVPAGPPLDPEDDGICWNPYGGGAYSMEFCFAPDPGACCLPDDSCEDLREGECLAIFGEFAAPGITCEDVAADLGQSPCPLPQRACCIEDGCQDRNKYACVEAGGEWVEDALCGDPLDPCTPNGACCVNGACLENQTQEQCAAAGGVYRGDDTACGTIPVPCTAGACCTDTDCSFLDNYENCIDAGGSFAGFGTTCDTDPCEPTGACCADECLDGLTDWECWAEFGLYRGDWTACASLSPACGLGACCVLGQGCFSELSWAICEQFPGGVFQGTGTDCDSLESGCAGNCCSDIGCLGGWSPQACTSAPGGVFLDYGVDCADAVPCGKVLRKACCLPSGACVVATQDACTSLDGVQQGTLTCNGVSCDPPGSVGACCLPGDTCAELTATACTDAGGAYSGDDTPCTAGLCLLVGACCIGGPGEQCEVLSPSGCVDTAQGEYLGHETACTPNPCVPAPGACCLAGGICEDVDDDDECAALGGDFQLGVDCASNPCPAVGACCDEETWTCTEDVTETDCSAAGGRYGGDDTDCTTIDPICVAPPTGACCDEETWTCTEEVIEADCLAGDGRYGGDESDCETIDPACAAPPTGACCDDTTGTCTDDVIEADCLDGNGRYAGDDSECETIQPPCVGPPTGACCDEATGDCTDDVTDADCSASGGSYGGDDTECKTIIPPCVGPPTGACCDEATGDCVDDVTQADCSASGGSYGGDDTECKTLIPPCVGPPTGACCVEDVCTTETESACIDSGGTYHGDDEPCEPDPCGAIVIIGASPWDGAIDAGQTGEITEDCVSPEGWASIDITFSGNASGLGVDDFTVAVDPPDVSAPPIAGALAIGNTVTLAFSEPIPAEHWTIITHTVSGTSTRIGFLPADVTGDGTSGPLDILALIDFLNGVGDPLEEWSADINRSNEANSADILREIDLLNGAGCYIEWNGLSLP